MSEETQALRDHLVDFLRANGHLNSEAVGGAFRHVPRHRFVPGEPLDQVYSDRHFVTKLRDGVSVSSASQPAVMAVMLEQLQVEPGMRVLEIGAGTGYNAALLAELVGASGRVVTIDILPDVAEEARQRLEAAGYGDVQVITGDGGFGYAPGAPYDRIIVTAGCWRIPPSWLEQLKDGGILLLPFRLNLDTACVAFRKKRSRLKSLSCSSAAFIPLIGSFGRLPGRKLLSATDAWLLWDYEGERLDADKLVRLLESRPIGVSLDKRVTTLDCSLDLGGFIALHGEPIVMLTPRDSRRWSDTKWGLVDTQVSSACLTAAGNDGRCELYGEDSTFLALKNYVEWWLAAGMPGKSQLRLEAAPSTGAAPGLTSLPQAGGNGRFRFRRGDLAFTADYAAN